MHMYVLAYTLSHLINGLELVVLSRTRCPAVVSQFLNVLKHEFNPDWCVSFLDDVSNTIEVVVNTSLYERIMCVCVCVTERLNEIQCDSKYSSSPWPEGGPNLSR